MELWISIPEWRISVSQVSSGCRTYGFSRYFQKNEQNREGRERMEELQHRQKAEGLPSSLCFLVLSLYILDTVLSVTYG